MSQYFFPAVIGSFSPFFRMCSLRSSLRLLQRSECNFSRCGGQGAALPPLLQHRYSQHRYIYYLFVKQTGIPVLILFEISNAIVLLQFRYHRGLFRHRSDKPQKRQADWGFANSSRQLWYRTWAWGSALEVLVYPLNCSKGHVWTVMKGDRSR